MRRIVSGRHSRSPRSQGWVAGALAVVPLLLLPAAAAGAAPPPAPASGATPPAYTNYPAPPPLATSAGEPSLSYDAKSGNVMFEAGLQTLRVSFDDSTSPARAAWTDVSYVLTSMLTLDPILYTERTTGRTFVSQLAGATSLMAYSDDGGATWTPS